jgi:SagB-type dehydrogenase family enzyme
MPKPGDIATRYHERSKHHFHRYARSLGYLDWATQPDPFRRFAGAPIIELPFREDGEGPIYDDLFTPSAITPKPVNVESIASLFELSLALSAWKTYQGSRWALRINPSSGNLHPTEGYLFAGPISGLSDQAGVYHYAPKEHALERRATFHAALWTQLFASPRANGNHSESECFIVALTSIHWREAWKYGERAYRYCQEDAGHALAAIALSAAVNGWHAALLNSVNDEQISTLLGLNRSEDFADAEPEHPDFLIAVAPNATQIQTIGNLVLSQKALHSIAEQAKWTGRANRLSAEHVEWDVIDEVSAACVKSEALVLQRADPEEIDDFQTMMDLSPRRVALSAAKIIRQRRSAVAFDGETALSAEQFFAMLCRVMAFRSPPLFALGAPECIHLGLFVHRVTGLDSGLYCLPRTSKGNLALREAMSTAFAWQKPPGCPSALPLFLLQKLNVTALAAQVSCGQEIAGDSAFSLGFIAEFAGPLRQFGDWFYRRLYWEAGAIAQVLYLEAEAAGLRATGIGCFFDDPVHDVFGLRDNTFQSLYHFTLGGHVDDARLTTQPPYPDEMVNSR